MVWMMLDDVFVVCMVFARCKCIFVFSDLIIAENVKCNKSIGKVFLMIKNGLGFMVSQMHSLFYIVVDNGT